MNASTKVKRALASLMQKTGVVSWKLGRYPGDAACVLMYHRVIPQGSMSAAAQPGMVVEPETLAMHLQYLRRHFTVVPLSFLAPARNRAAQASAGKPLCVLTFDDGWRDFYEYAYPVLQAYDAPATVFLPTDFIGTSRWFWTDQLALLLGRLSGPAARGMRLPSTGDVLHEELTSGPRSLEHRLERAIAVLKPRSIEEIDAVIARLAAAVGEMPNLPDRAFLSWEEVQEMHSSGLVQFGSHTSSHLLLTNVSEKQARCELRRSREGLLERGVVNRDSVCFSYPNGNWSDRLSELVQAEGYCLAVTTQPGWHYHRANPFAIRRIAIHQDMTSTAGMFGSRIARLI
jgi:peptidoglycan/xylan/chitin deacetylase (PgdA/CDA1 family)